MAYAGYGAQNGSAVVTAISARRAASESKGCDEASGISASRVGAYPALVPMASEFAIRAVKS